MKSNKKGDAPEGYITLYLGLNNLNTTQALVLSHLLRYCNKKKVYTNNYKFLSQGVALSELTIRKKIIPKLIEKGLIERIIDRNKVKFKILCNRPRKFLSIPRLFIGKLSLRDTMILTWIMYKSYNNGECRISVEELTKILPYSRRSIFLSLKNLLSNKYIIKENKIYKVNVKTFSHKEREVLMKTFIGLKSAKRLPQKVQNGSPLVQNGSPLECKTGHPNINKNINNKYKMNKIGEAVTECSPLSEKIKGRDNTRNSTLSKEKSLNEKLNKIRKEKIKKFKEKDYKSIGVTRYYEIIYLVLAEKGILIPQQPTLKIMGSLKKSLKILKENEIHPKDYVEWVCENWERLKREYTYGNGKSMLSENPNPIEILYQTSYFLGSMIVKDEQKVINLKSFSNYIEL